jgi:F-type H+-transporting ATPase subunit a
VKKIIILGTIISLYIFFIIFALTPTGGHHADGMQEVVVGHLSDYPIKEISSAVTDNPIAQLAIKMNNFIAVDLNEKILKNIVVDFGPAFPKSDLRITKWVLMMFIAAILILLVFIPLSRSVKKAQAGSKSRWVNLWEVLIAFVHDEVVTPNFDKKYVNKAMPYFLSIFFFILFTNFIGLVPGMATAAGNLAVAMGLASLTLVGMFLIGFIKQGPLWIVKGIVPSGVPLGMYLILWPIELLGMFIKPFALMVRLFANMMAGHVVIIVFLYLVMMFQNLYVGFGSVAGALFIYMLEILVSLIQAYIFTALSAMFIGASMHAH